MSETANSSSKPTKALITLWLSVGIILISAVTCAFVIFFNTKYVHPRGDEIGFKNFIDVYHFPISILIFGAGFVTLCVTIYRTYQSEKRIQQTETQLILVRDQLNQNELEFRTSQRPYVYPEFKIVINDSYFEIKNLVIYNYGSYPAILRNWYFVLSSQETENVYENTRNDENGLIVLHKCPY